MFGAILGGLGSLVSGFMGSQSADKAAKLQAQAAREATAEQRRQYDLSRSDYMPYLNRGNLAGDAYANLLGLNGAGARQTALDQGFYKGPDFQYRFDNAMNMLDQSAVNRGTMQSGAALKALQKSGADIGSTAWGDYANRLAGLTGAGQTATQGLAGIGANTANQISNIAMQNGANQASSYMAGRNALSQGISGGLGALAYGFGQQGY